MRNELMGLWAYWLIGLLCLLYFVPCANGSSGDGIDYYSPENILKFADYLYRYGDYLRAAGEYQRYFFLSPQNTDSTLYKIGLCYRLDNDTEKAVETFRKIGDGSFRTAASYQIAYSYFLSGQYEKSNQFLDEVLDIPEDERGKFHLLSAYNYLYQKRWHDAETKLSEFTYDDELNGIALSLKRSAQEGSMLPCKSPALAGLLSAVLPGTGKFYCGQYGDGFYSLSLVCATGLLAWDGFRDDGICSVKGWIFGSVGAIFYTGNIYGSSVAARIHNHQLEENLLKSLPIPNRYVSSEASVPGHPGNPEER